VTHPDGCPCRLCWLAAFDPRHAAGFAGHTLARPADGAYPPAPDPAEVLRVGVNACVHLGVVEPGEGGPCVFRRHWCDWFGEFVTVKKCERSPRSCEGCPEFERKG
jgi:hypothetical protein